MTTMDAALLVLRLVAGLTFAAHGAQKMFGWWGGSGFAGWQAVMVRMGFRPAGTFAIVSALAELLGGLMLAVGLATPLAAAVLVAQTVVIIAAAHWKRGFFNRDNGYEFPLSLGAGVVAILLGGAGGLSLDAAIGFDPSAEVRVVLLVAGVLAGTVALAVPRLSRGPSAPVP
ncbi:MAG TPA: DoxX family protein [Candidatus Bathyarchaeia archaeon]|jgi:putative oxidoreductase|nr:DoxX family protein [Candidatus Bathyarchaeia archaeon]